MSFKAIYYGDCIVVDPNPWGYLFLSSLFVFLLVATTLILHMFHVAYFTRFKPAPGKPPTQLGYTHGHYLSWTYRMRAKAWYQYSCNFLICYTVVAVTYMFYHGLNSEYWFDFLCNQAQSLLLTVVGATGFRSPDETAFNIDTHEFRHLHFKRGRRDLLNQSNEDFTKQLEQAVYYAKFGETKYLEGLIDLEKSELGSWDDVLHILDPVHKGSDEVGKRQAKAREPGSIAQPLLS